MTKLRKIQITCKAKPFTTSQTMDVHHHDVTTQYPKCHYTMALFSSTSFCQIFQDSPPHRIFGRMHEALNIDKK
jgi:ribonuclease I